MNGHEHHDYIDAPRVFYVVDAATAAQRYAQAAGGAQTRFVEGVQQTQKDPGALAAAAQNKLLTNFQNAVNSGYWARRVQEGGAAAWKAAVAAKANNYATGVNAAQGKFQAGYANFWNYMQPYLNQIQSMPNNSLQDAIAKSAAFITAAAAYQKP